MLCVTPAAGFVGRVTAVVFISLLVCFGFSVGLLETFNLAYGGDMLNYNKK